MADKKDLLAGAVARHVLDHGITGHGIRALAKAAGTSDRMLIYYFGSKDELLRQSMNLIVQGLSEQLDAELGDRHQTAEDLLTSLTLMSRKESWRPVMNLWFEIVGLAARGTHPFDRIAREVAEIFISWIALHLLPEQTDQAADLFAHLEGRAMLQVINGWKNP